MAVNDPKDVSAARLIHSLARLSDQPSDQLVSVQEWATRLLNTQTASLPALRARANTDLAAWHNFCDRLGVSHALAADIRRAAVVRSLVPASKAAEKALLAMASPRMKAELSGCCPEHGSDDRAVHSASGLAIKAPAPASSGSRGDKSSLLFTPFKKRDDAPMSRQDREKFAWPEDTPYQNLLNQEGSIGRGDLNKQMRSLIDASSREATWIPSSVDPRRTSFGEAETATAVLTPTTPTATKNKARRRVRQTAQKPSGLSRRAPVSDSDSSDESPESASAEEEQQVVNRRTVTSSGRKVTKRRRLSTDTVNPESRPVASRPARLSRPIQADSPLRTRDYWIDALSTLLQKYPRNHVIVSETEVDPSGQPRLFCLDCERSYATGPGRTLQNFEKHLRRYGVHGLNPQSAAAQQRQQLRAERERMAKEAAEKKAKRADVDADETEEEGKEKVDHDNIATEETKTTNATTSGRAKPTMEVNVTVNDTLVTETPATSPNGSDAENMAAANDDPASSSSSMHHAADDDLTSPRPDRRALSEHTANSVSSVLSSPRKLMSPVEMISPRITASAH